MSTFIIGRSSIKIIAESRREGIFVGGVEAWKCGRQVPSIFPSFHPPSLSLPVLKSYIVFFGLIVLFLGIGCQGKNTSTDALRLEIDTRNSQPLRQALYGFNTNMINGDYGYLDTNFVELTKVLAPKPCGFPVGQSEISTIGNLVAFLRMKWYQPSIQNLIVGTKEIMLDSKSCERVKSFLMTLCSYATH